MICPNCYKEHTLTAERGNVPITQDVITCLACKYTLTPTQLEHLEAMIVAKRRLYI